MFKRKKAVKYNNTKCEYRGIKFDSNAEMRRYQELELLQRAGEIQALELQPEFILLEKFRYKGKAIRAVKYIADFRYLEVASNTIIIEDLKSLITEVLVSYK